MTEKYKEINDSLSLVFFESKCNIFPVHIACGTIIDLIETSIEVVVLNASSNSDLFLSDLVLSFKKSTK